MSILSSRLKIGLLGVGIFILINQAYHFRYFLWGTFNESFTTWDFQLPPAGQEFYVKGSHPPRAMERIIRRAFPEFKVVFSEERAPHLILKEYYTSTDFKQNVKAPYLAFSGERENLRWKRFKPSGYPFLEITAHKKEADNFIFLPFISYGKTNLRQLLTAAMKERRNNGIRPRQVAYISSHYIKEREKMFKLLRDRLGDQAVALGKCSRTLGFSAPGSYHDLKGIYKGYNFGFAMENHDRKGYVTEKITNVFEGGAIPVFWGDADLAGEFFNPGAFINIKAYKNFEAAADAIVEISKNPDLLHKMLRTPIFKNNEIHPLLLVNDDVLTEKEEALLQEMAQKLRKAYDLYLDNKRQGRPYWKALDLPFLIKENFKKRNSF
jgi:hypothetical protein